MAGPEPGLRQHYQQGIDTPSTIQDVLERHNRYQDSMVQAFETHLRQIVLRAQARVLSDLQKRLSIEGDAIEASAANQRVLRSVGPLFMDAMREEGYDRLVEAFTGEFRRMMPFLDETFRLLGEEIDAKWQASGFTHRELNLLSSSQLNAAASIDAVIESTAGMAMTRGLFGVGGLRFGALAGVLTDRFEASIAQARTLADTSMTTFYRTAADIGYRTIEQDRPAQEVRYLYSGPDDKLTRPFCDHLIQLAKSYTREEIGRMNNHQLPNVFLTGGGWNCRHQWILDTKALTRTSSASQ